MVIYCRNSGWSVCVVFNVHIDAIVLWWWNWIYVWFLSSLFHYCCCSSIFIIQWVSTRVRDILKSSWSSNLLRANLGFECVGLSNISSHMVKFKFSCTERLCDFEPNCGPAPKTLSAAHLFAQHCYKLRQKTAHLVSYCLSIHRQSCNLQACQSTLSHSIPSWTSQIWQCKFCCISTFMSINKRKQHLSFFCVEV